MVSGHCLRAIVRLWACYGPLLYFVGCFDRMMIESSLWRWTGGVRAVVGCGARWRDSAAAMTAGCWRPGWTAAAGALEVEFVVFVLIVMRYGVPRRSVQ